MAAYTVLDNEAVNYIKSIDLAQYAALRLLVARNAVRRFCRDSGIWQATLTAITVVAGTANYALTISDADLVHVVWVKYRRTADADDQYSRITPMNRDRMENHFGGGWEFQTGTPTAFIVELPQTVKIYPIPTADDAGKLLVRVAKMPLMTSSSFEDFMYNGHREAILQAYLLEAYSMTNKPWSSPELAAKARITYEELMYYAQTIARQGKHEGDQLPYFPEFSGSRNQNGWNI